MENPGPEFMGMIEEIQAWVSRRIGKEWNDLFGSMVLISIPRQTEPIKGNVTGWVHPSDADKSSEELLLRSFFALCVTLMLAEKVNPITLHQLIMRAAEHTGMGIVIDVDDEPDDMIQN